MTRIPKLRHHKGRNQAAVVLDGRYFYLGTWGSDAAQRNYDRTIQEWLAMGRRSPITASGVDEVGISITELCVRYFDYAKTYYVKHGKVTDEVAAIRVAIRTVRRLYGPEPAARFGPLKLKAVRQVWIDEGTRPAKPATAKPGPTQGNCRRYVNKKTDLVRRMFRWAVAEEMVPPDVLHGLAAVTGLRKGRTEAVDHPPVPPVDWKDVEAVLPHLPRAVAAMVQVQALTGMRPGEVVQMRMRDIDRGDSIWTYVPPSHKTEHHGQGRQVAIGPKAQEIVREFFKADPDLYLFSPRDAEEERNARRRARRQSPMTPSQRARVHKQAPKRSAGEHYTTASYGRAITRGCRLASINRWKPNQLRHSRATEVRQAFGLEAAQVSLGHSKADVTQVYTERDLKLAKKVARELG